MSVRVAPASIKDRMMSKLYKLRRDIKKNPDKYKHSAGAGFNIYGDVYVGYWIKGYKKFIKKTLKEL